MGSFRTREIKNSKNKEEEKMKIITVKLRLITNCDIPVEVTLADIKTNLTEILEKEAWVVDEIVIKEANRGK
jgi:hypothetical protein